MEGSVEAVCLVAVEAALVVLAWKFRRGQWLNLIAGNTFASGEDRRRPYQKRMGRDVSNVLIGCAMGLPAVVAIGCLSDHGAIGSQADLVAFIVLMAALIAACARLSVRARRAEREEDRALGRPDPKEEERRLERVQAVVIGTIIVVVLGISLMAVPMMS